MCVCLCGVRGVGEMRCSCKAMSLALAVYGEQDVLVCVVACEWAVLFTVVLCVCVCGLSD
jgi:hypothetical protein